MSASRIVVLNKSGKPVKYSDSGMRIPPGETRELDEDETVKKAIDEGRLALVAVIPARVSAPEPVPAPQEVAETETVEPSSAEEAVEQEEVEADEAETEAGEQTSSSKKKISSRSKES